jgi:soluble lytic murein transglycosylase-like protein
MRPFRQTGLAFLISALAAFCAPGARADYAVLRSGQRLHISGYLQQGSNILLYLTGGSVVVPATDVVRFEPEDTFTAVPHSSAPHVPFAAQIQAAAAQNGLDEKLVSSVISAESNFNSRAISPKHAMGLMQLMPRTAADLAVTNPFDPAQNIGAGTHYLKQLIDQFHGNLVLALAAYNAGPGAVALYGGVPPFSETHKYIRRVEKKLNASQSVSAKAPSEQ